MTDEPPLEAYDQQGVMPAPRRPRGDRAMSVDRLPPSSIEAEQGVLGCIMLAPYDCIYECITDFKDGPKAFYDLRHQLIYETIVEMSERIEVIDTITLQRRLRDKNQLDQVGGIAYLAALPDIVPSAANLKTYIKIVTDKYRLRKLISVCTDIVSNAYEWTDEVDLIIDQSESDFLNATRTQSAKIAVQCMPAVQRAITRMEAYSQNQGVLIGLSTGFIDLDRMTSGMKGGEMITLAARPSMGKTSLAMNIAEAVAIEQKQPVGFFSLEMTEDQLIERAICSRARVNIRNIREGFIADRDFPKITTAAGRVGASPIYIDDSSGLSIMELRARARRMWQLYGIKVFIIDYLQLLHSTARKAHNRQQEIGDISRGCKALAKDLNVPVIVLAQLNRELDKDKNRKPRLSDLRESGDIEQDSDLVGLLYKPASADDEDDGAEQEAVPVNLLIAKQRSGPCGDVRLTFLKSYTRFESAARITADDIADQSPQQQPLLEGEQNDQ